MFDDLVRDMKEKGLIAISQFKLIGHAAPVFGLLSIMATTKLFCPSRDYLDFIVAFNVWNGGSTGGSLR